MVISKWKKVKGMFSFVLEFSQVTSTITESLSVEGLRLYQTCILLYVPLKTPSYSITPRVFPLPIPLTHFHPNLLYNTTFSSSHTIPYILLWRPFFWIVLLEIFLYIICTHTIYVSIFISKKIWQEDLSYPKLSRTVLVKLNISTTSSPTPDQIPFFFMRFE